MLLRTIPNALGVFIDSWRPCSIHIITELSLLPNENVERLEEDSILTRTVINECNTVLHQPYITPIVPYPFI